MLKKYGCKNHIMTTLIIYSKTILFAIFFSQGSHRSKLALNLPQLAFATLATFGKKYIPGSHTYCSCIWTYTIKHINLHTSNTEKGN